jgi:prevent-host-death family protein
MSSVNVYEAKTHLSRLLRRVRAGEEIVIADAGRPVARLVPLATPTGPRRLGGDEQNVWIADDFDAPLPDDVTDGFYGVAGSSRKAARRAAGKRRR